MGAVTRFVLQTDRLLRPVRREQRIKSQRFRPSTRFIRKTRSDLQSEDNYTTSVTFDRSFIDTVHQRENLATVGRKSCHRKQSHKQHICPPCSVEALCRKKSNANAMTWRTNTSCSSSHKPASGLLYQCGTT